MKKTRQLHLWIGLICSIFILLQSVTGLLLMNKWILGGQEEGERPAFGQMQQMQPGTQAGDDRAQTGAADGSADPQAGAADTQAVSTDNNGSLPAGTASDMPAQGNGMQQGFGPGGGGPMGAGGQMGGGSAEMFIKNLHEGRIGSTDISIVINLAAIGMIFLTLTGIFLSVKTLRAQSKSRQKRLAKQAAPQ